MQFTRADALRLFGLYTLSYIAITALAIAATRTWQLDVRTDVIQTGLLAIAILLLIAQHRVLVPSLRRELTHANWWWHVVLGLIFVALCLGLVGFGAFLFSLPGAPLADWWNTRAETDISAILATLNQPIFSAGVLSHHIALWLVATGLLLIANWPIGNLLSRLSGKPGRPYILAATCVAVFNEVTARVAYDYGPSYLQNVPDYVPAIAALVAASLLAAFSAGVMSMAFFAMSEPDTTSAPGDNQTGPETPGQTVQAPPANTPDAIKLENQRP